MTGFDLSTISNCYIGNTAVSAIYIGSDKLWTTTQHDYSQDYLTFRAIDSGTFTFTANDLQYSLDNGTTWTTLTSGTASPTVSAGSKIMWKQTGLTPNSSNGIGTFSATGKFKVYGNIMSLYYGDNFVGQNDLTGKDYAFKSLFDCSNVTSYIADASNLILPATTLANNCYVNMFYNCTSLTTAPQILPATTLAQYCYSSMFANCASLITVPELPATTLVDSCYRQMFRDCTSLTTTPELPATTLANNCYRNMFTRCSSLVMASELPATTLDVESYRGMFLNCTSLTTAPELPATTLANGCYSNMFKGCSNLSSITMLATDISASSCLSSWVQSVAASGTFTKAASMTTLPTGNNGIPTGWTVQDAS